MKRRLTWKDAPPNNQDTAIPNPLHSRFSTGQLRQEESRSDVALRNHSLAQEAETDGQLPYIHCMYSREDILSTQPGPSAGGPLCRIPSKMVDPHRSYGETSPTATADRLADARDLFDEYGISRPAG